MLQNQIRADVPGTLHFPKRERVPWIWVLLAESRPYAVLDLLCITLLDRSDPAVHSWFRYGVQMVSKYKQ